MNRRTKPYSGGGGVVAPAMALQEQDRGLTIRKVTENGYETITVMNSWRFEGIYEVIPLFLVPMIWCIPDRNVFSRCNNTKFVGVRMLYQLNEEVVLR